MSFHILRFERMSAKSKFMLLLSFPVGLDLVSDQPKLKL